MSTTSLPDLPDETLPPSYYQNLGNDNKRKQQDEEGDDTDVGAVVGGVVAMLLIICVILGVAFWLIRRGICVTDVLKTLYEDKNFHAT